MNELIKRIAEYVIEQGKEQLCDDDFQTKIGYAYIQGQFADEIEEKIYEMTEIELSKNKQIADVTLEIDGFDIVFYKDFITT